MRYKLKYKSIKERGEQKRKEEEKGNHGKGERQRLKEIAGRE